VNGGGHRLGIDFGTSTTVAALAGRDGRVRPLLFDGSPLLPSAVYADAAMGLLVGADAVRAAVGSPAGFEGNPKRRVDEGTVWLGEREYPVADLVAAVLRRVGAEASRVAGGPVDEVVLTHPATWGRTRLAVLTAAAERAGLGTVRFVPEPVAAAAYFATVLGRTIPAERVIVVYDLGAGTFDVSVVRPSPGGFDVVATDGLPDVGGVDLDAAVVGHVRALTAGATTAWQRLDWPQNPADQQARQTLWQAARAVKEQLSRHPTGELHVPLVDQRVHLTREEFEKAARGQLDRTAALTLTVLRAAGIPPEQVAAVYLVGGSSRIPLAATLLHRTLRIAPTIIDQPELVVAEGALHNRPAPAPVPIPAPPPPIHPATAGPTRRRVPVAVLVALAAVVLLLTGGGILAATRPWAHPAATNTPTPGAPANVFPTETSGTWAGTYQQSDGHASQIELAITGGTGTAQVRYPDLGCLGTVTVLSRTGTSIRAQERIASGRCTPTGIMTIRPQPGGQLAVSYTPDIATYTATALLSRR
jgi:actin-like ATPase involved in cell morphogenesis